MPKIECQERNGIIMTLGTSPRSRDPREDKYAAVRTMPPATVNLNESVSLLKYCPSILSQQSIGACAQFTVAECDFITRQAARDKAHQPLNTELAHAGFLYEWTRRQHGWFPNDTGSWPADGFDILLTDKPLWSRAEYVSNAAFDYDDALFRNEKLIDDLASHRPFYVNDGDALQRIKQCLDLGWAISICMYWHPSYFNPIDGKLPEGASWDPSYGGHAMTIRGRTPDHGGLSAVINHWTAGWNTAVTRWGFDFRPGEVAIPDSFFLPGTNSPVYELRAASPEAVIPEPEPKPDPAKPPVVLKIVRQGENLKKWKVFGANVESDARCFVDGDDTGAVEDEQHFTFKRKLKPGGHSAVIANTKTTSAPFTFST